MYKGSKEDKDKDNKEADEEVHEVFPPPISKPVDQEEVKRLTEEANQYLTKGDMNGVIDSFFAVLDLDPTRVDVNTVLGSILLQRDELSLAQGFLYKAVALSDWRYPPAVANLAEGLRQDSQLLLAKDVLQKGWETGTPIFIELRHLSYRPLFISPAILVHLFSSRLLSTPLLSSPHPSQLLCSFLSFFSR